MTAPFDLLTPSCQKIKDHLEHELATIRTGRASPSLIEHVQVQAYGSVMKLTELATVSAPDPKTLLIEPWDKSALKDIERGLVAAQTGCGIAVDNNVIRVSVPVLTTETREQMMKQVMKEVEKAKIALRGIRDDVRGAIHLLEKNKLISEDEKFRQFERLDKEVKKWQETLEQMGERKVKELEF